jgi:hypothetical protein
MGWHRRRGAVVAPSVAPRCCKAHCPVGPGNCPAKKECFSGMRSRWGERDTQTLHQSTQNRAWAPMAPLATSELSSSQKYKPCPKSPLIYKKLSKTCAYTSKPESLERGSICGLCGQLPPPTSDTPQRGQAMEEDYYSKPPIVLYRATICDTCK